MKRITGIILVFALVFSLCSCSGGKTEGAPLTVNGTPVDGEVFRYFLNEAWNDKTVSGRDARIQKATELCIRYVAVNSTFTTSGLRLTQAQKNESGSRSNVLWNMFGKFYESIGVSKQTFVKIQLSGQYTEVLRLAYFDKGGPDEISDAALRGYFREYYAAFRMISAPLSKTDVYGEKQELTEEERKTIEDSYSRSAGQFNAGTSFDDICKMLATDVSASQEALETLVISPDDTEFSEAFYNSVRSVDEGKAGLFEDGEFIYLINRVDILSDPALFEKYRDECLLSASEIPLQSKINIMCNSYTSKRNSSLMGDYYREMAGVKGNG